VINLAGRQRMLIQQMTKEALQLKNEQDGAHIHALALQEAAATFNQTLLALTNGGQVPYLPDRPADVAATQDPAVLAGLQQVQRSWEIFRGHLDKMLTAESGSPGFAETAQAVEQLSPRLVQQADEVVRLYETASARKIARLRWIQGVFFAGALVLLAVGFWLTQKSVLAPLRRLGATATRIGRGDLNTPVQVVGPREIETLSHSFDAMRLQLKEAQDRLEYRVTQRTRELAAAFEFSQEIVADLHLKHLLASVTERACSLMGAQAATLCLLAPNGRYLEVAAGSGQNIAQVKQRQPAADGLTSQVIGAGQTVSTEITCANCGFLDTHAPGQCVAAPLRAGEQTLGALCVVRPQQAKFDPEETRALTLLANAAAIAIANARLAEAKQQQARQTAALAERERLAAELHDNLAQTLSFLNFKTDRLKELLADGQITETQPELEKMKTAINRAYGQVRAALVGLHEAATAESGEEAAQNLAQKLAEEVADFRQTSSLAVDLSIADPSCLALPDVSRRQALHIVREALTNIRRHVQARQAWVRVERANGEVRFTVEDDGCGFDPAAAGGDAHLGLTIMRARAKRSGGRLTVESAPDKGARIIAHFPLQTQKEASL
ncbi:MAG: ATP-binding protein, partial [Anaerolineae bacterium]